MIQEGYTQLVENIGFLFLKIPQKIQDELKITVDKIQNDFTKYIPITSKLAGQIDKEYSINLTHKATQYIRWCVDRYNEENPNYIQSFYKPKLQYNGEGWINFQEKYEYNPMHMHTGVFSYVIWYQIPFYRKNEIKYGAGKGKLPKNNQNGDFQFIYPVGQNLLTEPLFIDKTMERHIAIFPSSLNHIVYPFYTSDDYRITISGNIFLQD